MLFPPPQKQSFWSSHLLWFELTGSLVVILLLSAGITLIGAQVLARDTIRQSLNQRDHDIASEIAPLFATYYERAKTWKGSDDYVQVVQGRWARNEHDFFTLEVNPQDLDFVITDLDGIVVYRNGPDFARLSDVQVAGPSDGPPGSPPRQLDPRYGVPITSQDSTLGLLYVRAMGSSTFSKKEEAFLDDIEGSILVTTIIGMACAVLLGSLVMGRITRPLTLLATAANRIASGKFETQVHIPRRDEIGSLGRSFNIMASELKRNEDMRKILIDDVAHELRTPIALIQGNLEMMLSGVYKADNERISMLHQECVVLSRLISDLHMLNDMDREKRGLHLETVDVLGLLEGMHKEYISEFASCDMCLSFAADTGNFVMQADPSHLREALHNILGNSIRYAGKGASVHMELSHMREKVELRISDNGPGVPGSDLEKIFDRFFRVDQSRNRSTGGAGIGLSITKRIIEAHGGSIRARHAVPHGLEICIDLPAA